MKKLLKEVRDCTFCEPHLPLGARPIISGNERSKIILISQAPGRVVHESGIAWNDQSGKKLREWLDVDSTTFYNEDNFAVFPMGFCYPGKAKTGDLPPRKECAPLWHKTVIEKFKNAKLFVLIGAYANKYYLSKDKKLTEVVSEYQDYLPTYFPLPHPSPVNRFWRMKNPWFEEEVVPQLREKVKEILNED
ncbi:uracil-DNA glycosylase family protein [Mesonia aestuariivivens]|uniref:Uracil-DNA glycosylase family protein n=1 Tax=Mesonia aestuariivivens TaxID=2796128 RepID=A0ABS6W192_9FLAO|nr:uracil-DNA glycosylase family protein [Mesonia aestuariivivens]MBW2961623.1 uracil-DNA glycosylase family protein [Mesonia aestuariivivens]